MTAAVIHQVSRQDAGLDRGRVDLYWLPLGAGGRCVRANGRIYEAVAARLAGRERTGPLPLRPRGPPFR